MFLRNNKYQIVAIDPDCFLNEKEFYRRIWKIMFNIDMSKGDTSFNDVLLKYIQGSILLI